MLERNESTATKECLGGWKGLMSIKVVLLGRDREISLKINFSLISTFSYDIGVRATPNGSPI